MKKLFISIFMMLAVGSTVYCQNVKQNGNNFTEVTTPRNESKATKTQYTYTDKQGNTYPVYLSAKGKAYIEKPGYRTNKQTGKKEKVMTKKYLPEVGKKINPEAYKEN